MPLFAPFAFRDFRQRIVARGDASDGLGDGNDFCPFAGLGKDQSRIGGGVVVEGYALNGIDRLLRNFAIASARGIRRAALFGSVARGDDHPDSDLDIMIEVDPETHMTVYEYVGLKEYVAGLFDGTVDVVSRHGLKPYVAPAATADAIYAF